MPSISSHSIFVDTEFDYYPEDYIDDCSYEEVTELASLIKEKYPELITGRGSKNTFSVSENEFESSLDALHNKWNMLTAEEESTIKNIASRFL
jgi:hypothetical protein